MASGVLGKCKTCTKRDVFERISQLKNNPEWIAKERERCRIKQAKYREMGVACKTTKETRIRWAKNNPHKIKAHKDANNAVLSGKIQKLSICQSCGASGDIEMHHEDYSRPLDVVWLCVKCHGKTRRKK